MLAERFVRTAQGQDRFLRAADRALRQGVGLDLGVLEKVSHLVETREDVPFFELRRLEDDLGVDGGSLLTLGPENLHRTVEVDVRHRCALYLLFGGRVEAEATGTGSLYIHPYALSVCLSLEV